MSELKPCPFCGAAASLEDCDHPDFECVVCDDCGASGPDRRVEQSPLAVEAWNTRVDDNCIAELEGCIAYAVSRLAIGETAEALAHLEQALEQKP